MAHGVYVHIPFCTRRCDYCAFATWTDRFHLVDRYIEACVAEAGARCSDPATSVFFGGGTPSLLAPARLGRLLDAIPRAPDAEITVECNPDTVDAGKLEGYAAAGVNRLSFGVQSMAAPVLVSLGRQHDPDSVSRAIRAAAAAGLGDRYSVDLIYGAAGESIDAWARSLEAVLGLDPPPSHVSAYALTVEPGTPLAAAPDRHPEPDDQADKYAIADDLLSAAGLEWYEISNWARPGYECRHNQLYWEQGDYVGLGCAAHSHRHGRRSWNIRHLDRYIRAIEERGDAETGCEDLDAVTRRHEQLELALRTRRGVPHAALPVRELGDLVEPTGPGWVRLSRRGRLLANEVSLRLLTV